ncbi:MAG: C39 family peptidase [Patescibacteria group bacterium]
MKTKALLFNIFLILLIVAGLGYLGRHRIETIWHDWITEPAPAALTYEQIINKRITQNANLVVNQNTNQEPVAAIPDEFNLAVPFTTQAPLVNWDEQHEESCEEAAALIVHYYWQKKTFTPTIANKELQTIVDYENANLGFYKDTTAEQTAEFIRGLWGYKKVAVKYDFTLDDIKKEIAQGRPVIVPTAGRMLGNPNFKSPGPLYHMIVIRGWTKDMIITNDPGTRKGEGYQYTPEVIMNAIHDWNSGDVDNGQKAMIVVWPND